MDSLSIMPIGVIRSPRNQPVDDFWGDMISEIHLAPGFGPEALYGLSDFSHAEIIFVMNQVDPAKVERGARHPREREDWPLVGIFAQRGKNRPNRLALSCCRIVAVGGTVLTVEGLDAIDGTPVADIKPHMREFAPRGAVRQAAWATELMQDYYKLGSERPAK